MSDYLQSLAKLSRLDRKGIDLGLSKTKKILKIFQSPHQKFKSIHVAGTNGKGSTVAMLSSILQAAGYHVGSFYSPHVLDIRERIQVNQKWISKQDFLNLTQQIYQVMETHKIDLSYFEFLTVMAFLHYRNQNVDVGVIEVGLGGRLDATNVITPEVSVITTISHDHHRFLGNTLTKIAKEKAGIIKYKRPCVTGVRRPSVFKTIQKIARQKKSPLYAASLEENFSYTLGLQGAYQTQNARLVLKTTQVLNQKGFFISERALQKGFLTANIVGRFEKICSSPTVIVDGAHNVDGIRTCMHALNEAFPHSRRFVILGICQDKNTKKMVQMVQKNVNHTHFIEIPTPRSWKVSSHKQLKDVYPKVIQKMHEKDVLCITGSLYAVEAAKRYFESRC